MYLTLFSYFATVSPQEIRTGVLFMIMGSLVFIFRKPIARANARAQNKAWGTHYTEEENMSAHIWVSVATFVVGVSTALNVPDITISGRWQDMLGGSLFILLGLFMIFSKEKNDRAVMHFDGKPAVFRIGKVKVYLHRVLITILSLAVIVSGLVLVTRAVSL